MNKHAYLIIAHNDFAILESLLSMLDDVRNDIYIHIDLKANDLYQRACNVQMQSANLFVLKNRIKAYWGDISLIDVEYLLFETAFNNHTYAYYHLLSGVDLPLKNQEYIHNFFTKNHGKEFVEFWNEEHHIRDLKRKVSRYYFLLKYYKNKKHLLHAATSFLRNSALAIQKILRLRRINNYNFKKGSQWISITHAFCDHIIKHKTSIKQRLRFTLCPDEIFIQTLLWNSPFKENIYNVENPQKVSIRLIDWTRGNPYVWQDSDLNELISSECLFARKFSSHSSTLHKQLKNFIQNEH